MRVNKQGNLKPLLTIILVYILLVIGITLLPGKIPYETVKESGPVEVLSAYGYFLFCLFILYFNVIGAIRTSFAPGFFVLLLGLRELDFHARFTTMGMFKSRFFISPEVPILEKTIVVVFIVALITYGVIYLRKVLPRFKKDLKAARPYAVSLSCAVGCIILSKVFDSNSDLFEHAFFMVEDPYALSLTIEECLELLIPLFLIRSLLQYSWDSVKGRVT